MRKWLFYGILCASLLLLCLSTVQAEEGGEGRIEVFSTVCAEENDTACGENPALCAAWTVSLRAPASLIRSGEAVAVRITVAVAPEWKILHISVPTGGEEDVWHGTVGAPKEAGSSITVMLDGVPDLQRDADTEKGSVTIDLFSVRAALPEGKDTAAFEGSLTASPLELTLPDGALYVRRLNGRVVCYPAMVLLDAAPAPWESEPDAVPESPGAPETLMPEPPSETVPAHAESAELTESTALALSQPPVSAEAVEPPAPEELPRSSLWFVGCCETPVSDGSFAVRFLFYVPTPATTGTGEGSTPTGAARTPVICLEGGGVLTVETEPADPAAAVMLLGAWEQATGATVDAGGQLWMCTFRGLRSEREYDFFVDAGTDFFRVFYEQGRFCSMTEQRSYDGRHCQ